MRFGGLTILDTAGWGDKKIKDYTPDRAKSEFQRALDIHNKRMMEVMSRYVAGSSEEKRYQVNGSAGSMKMYPKRLGAGNVAPQASNFEPYYLGVRLDSHQAARVWDERYFLLETVENMNIEMTELITADRRFMQKRVLCAMFDNTSYTWYDEENYNEALFIKPLLNADSLPIAMDADGNSFNAATHAHHVSITAVNDANFLAACDNLLEHTRSGTVIVEIAKADAAQYIALTGFKAPTDVRFIQADNTVRLNKVRDLHDSPYDRYLGAVEGINAEIWVRPYIPTNYASYRLEGSDLDKPLVGRRDFLESADLSMVEPDKLHPDLSGTLVQRTWGCSVRERRNGVITFKDAGAGPYVIPTGYSKADLLIPS